MELSDKLVNEIWTLAETAVNEGARPKEVVKELKSAWVEVYKDAAKDADQEFGYMLRTPYKGC